MMDLAREWFIEGEERGRICDLVADVFVGVPIFVIQRAVTVAYQDLQQEQAQRRDQALEWHRRGSRGGGGCAQQPGMGVAPALEGATPSQGRAAGPRRRRREPDGQAR